MDDYVIDDLKEAGVKMRVFDLLKTRIEKMEEKSDIKGLILALKDDDEQLRLESARALGKIGSPEAIEPLTQTLHDPDKGVKEEAITALGKIGDPKATPPLIDALNSQYISIRWRAAQALGKIGSPEAIEPLTQTLHDPDKEVREEAITALGRINIQPILKDLKSNDSGVKSDAITEVNRPPKKSKPQTINNKSKVRISTGPEEKISKPPEKEIVKEAGITESTKVTDSEKKEPETEETGEKKLGFKETVRLISKGKIKETPKVQLSIEDKQEITPSDEEKPVITSNKEDKEEITQKTEEKSDLKETKTIKIAKKDRKLKTKEISRAKDKKRELSSPDEEIKNLEKPPEIEKEAPSIEGESSLEPTSIHDEKIEQMTMAPKTQETPDFKDKLETDPMNNEVIEKEEVIMVENDTGAETEVSINSGLEREESEEENIFISSDNADFKDREKKLYDKGLYHLIRRFVRKSKYEYLDNFMRKSRYDYQFTDLQKLKDLLVYKGIEFTAEEIRWLVQEEVKKQDYQEFEDKILLTEHQSLEQYLENYIKNYPLDTPENIQNMEKLLRKERIATENLIKHIDKTRRRKEILDFQNKLLQPTMGTLEEKDSPSILIKFMKKDLLEKRDKLISTGEYKYIENFLRMSKYDYHMGDLQKFKNMLEYKGITFQDEEMIWLIQEEIKKQDYQEFEERIMETQPHKPQQYLENYINSYHLDTPENIQNMEKLLHKERIPTKNMIEQIEKARKEKEIEEFEKKLYKKLEPSYNSIPVIESNVSKDKALKNAQILNNLGNLFYDLGKPDEALLYYDKSLYIYPDYIDAWKNKGLIFYTMGRSQKAVACYNHVLKIDPDYGEVWLDIGVILFELGKLREAKICYDKALDMDPSYNKETSLYSRRFLHKNPYYQEIFDNYLDSVSSIELLEESSDSLSPISQIMQLLMNLNH
ncbi:MAG: HEAT repeat domain-containing protein [Methanobacterium sp.]|nr:HEAT repeat domain-containing protein [Methanobacterium sp.]